MKSEYTYKHDGIEYEVHVDKNGNTFTIPKGSISPFDIVNNGKAIDPNTINHNNTAYPPPIDWGIGDDLKLKDLKPAKPAIKPSIDWDIIKIKDLPDGYLGGLDIARKSSPLKPLEDKFVIKTKDGKYFFNEFKKKSLDYDARTFDSVMEALKFADNISEETIVDKL